MVYSKDKELPDERIRREWMLKQDKDWIISYYRDKTNIIMAVFLIFIAILTAALCIQGYYYENINEDNHWTNEQVYLLSDEYCHLAYGEDSISISGTLMYRKGIDVMCYDTEGNKLGGKVFV